MLLFQQNLQESLIESQLEQLFRESDRDMAVKDHPLIIVYEEETRSFPCRLCGHMYYNETELDRHIKGFYEEKRKWYCQHCHKEFLKDRNKLLHEGYIISPYRFK